MVCFNSLLVSLRDNGFQSIEVGNPLIFLDAAFTFRDKVNRVIYPRSLFHSNIRRAYKYDIEI